MADEVLGEAQNWLEAYQKSSFKLLAMSPTAWGSWAHRHKRAADALYNIAFLAEERFTERMKKAPIVEVGVVHYLEGEELEEYWDQQMLSEYLLLAGYALECLAKGYRIATNPHLVENGEKLSGVIKTHDLRRLFRDCGIETSDEEAKVLDTLTVQVVWGKYPTPLDYTKLPSPFGAGLINPFQVLKPLIDGLYERAGECLGAEVKKRQDNAPPQS